MRISHLSAFPALILVVGLWQTPSWAGPEVVRIVEKDIRYEPQKITVKRGQTLRLVNNDPFFHKSRIARLSKGGEETTVVVVAQREEAGEQRGTRLTEAGDYKLRCMVHDGMTAIVHVTE